MGGVNEAEGLPSPQAEEEAKGSLWSRVGLARIFEMEGMALGAIDFLPPMTPEPSCDTFAS